MSRRVPEIIIIGTMKGGTSILWARLCRHPNVVAGAAKEVHYFTMHFDKSSEWYVSQFPDRDEETLAVDASPTYFDTATTTLIPERIAEIAPSARIILTVRDPIERAISHYYQLRKSPNTGATFKDVNINEFFQSALGKVDASSNPHLNHMKYAIEFSKYDVKFENYVKIFGRDRILVVENDDIVGNPAKVMRRIHDHCGIQMGSSNVHGGDYPLDRRRDEIDPNISSKLSERLGPSYSRFRSLAELGPRDIN